MNYWDLHERSKRVALDLFLIETMIAVGDRKEKVLAQLASTRAVAQSVQTDAARLYEEHREF